MKKSLTIAFLYFSLNCFSQTIPPVGGYTSLDEIRNASPSYSSTFNVIKRSRGDIAAWGGSDYKVENVKISNKELKSIYAVSAGDSIYFNSKKVSGRGGFSGVEIFGRFTVVNSNWPTQKIASEIGLGKFEYSGLAKTGGAIGGGAAGKQLALARVPIIIDLNTGVKYSLSKSSLKKLFEKDYIELYNTLEKEGEVSNELLIEYLIQANNRD